MKYVIEMSFRVGGTTYYFDHLGKWNWLNENDWKTRTRLPLKCYGQTIITQTSIFKGKFNAILVSQYLRQFFERTNYSFNECPMCEVISV